MNIVARISAADGYRAALAAMLVVLTVATEPQESCGQSPAPQSDPAATSEPKQPPADFAAQLDALHEKARKARDKKDFSQVEELRLERLALAKDSSGKSAWIAGAQAIAEADALIAARKLPIFSSRNVVAAAWAGLPSNSTRPCLVPHDAYLAALGGRTRDKN